MTTDSRLGQFEEGLRLIVRNETGATAPSATSTRATEVERSPQELSGGQQALLGLALVLALSSYQAPPLCLLDEVDAALDETNQVMLLYMHAWGGMNVSLRSTFETEGVPVALYLFYTICVISIPSVHPQAASARLLAMRFKESQAFCVSHHGDFHRQSDSIVAVEMCDGVSRVRA